MRKFAIAAVLALLVAPMAVSTAQADETVTVDPATFTFGFMNVFELDCTTFVFNSSWGFADLTASFDGSTLCLGPNTINDPNEFWYQCADGRTPPDCGGPGSPGNKCMEAIAHAQDETGQYANMILTFSACVTANTLTSAHKTEAFIREFAPGFASIVGETKLELTGTGDFSIDLAISGQGGPVQYGFITTGENVWPGDEGPFGTIKIDSDCPVATEPATWGQIKSLMD